MAELRKAKLRVYLTVAEEHEIDGARVTELVADYQRVDEPGSPLSGVWTIVRATAWGAGTPGPLLASWRATGAAVPPWVGELVGRYSPDQDLAELQALGQAGGVEL